MSRRIHRVDGGPVNTVNVATSTIASFDLTADPAFLTASGSFLDVLNNVSFHVEGVLIGKVTGTGSLSGRFSRCFDRIAGTLSALGTVTNVIPMQGTAGLLAAVGDLNITGTTIRLQATGIALTTIEWTGYLQIYSGNFTG